MLRTAESVSPRHPDKTCDIIADSILDACLEQDENSRVAMEVLGGHGIITITGELTTTAYVDVREIVRKIVGDKYGVQTNIVRQSPDIAKGVDAGGAGDQGIMVGYACNETPELMPLEVMLVRKLCQFLYAKWPVDGKTQITIKDNKVVAAVASFCTVDGQDLHYAIEKWLTAVDCADVFEVFANPAGDWNIGGFDADTGLTGRKIAVDSYGPRIPIGGGAFSGKDATKVDRPGAYMARKIAVDYLNKFKAKEVLTRLAYAIGRAEPLETTAIVDGKEVEIVGYDLTPSGIIKFLDLKRPQFERLATLGHFGTNNIWDK